MILLSNSLTSPGIGLIVWAVLIFGVFFLILAKFAWKPILAAVKARDQGITGFSSKSTRRNAQAAER
jgi:F-type H+-transporting ATPase subunit b